MLAGLQLAHRLAPRVAVSYLGVVTHRNELVKYWDSCVRVKEDWSRQEIHQLGLGYWWVPAVSKLSVHLFFERFRKQGKDLPGVVLIDSKYNVHHRQAMERKALACSEAFPEFSLPNCAIVALDPALQLEGSRDKNEGDAARYIQKILKGQLDAGIDEESLAQVEYMLIVQLASMAASKNRSKYEAWRRISRFRQDMKLDQQRIENAIHEAYQQSLDLFGRGGDDGDGDEDDDEWEYEDDEYFEDE